MSRLFILAIVAMVAVPAQAEAARFRFGSAKRIATPVATQTPTISRAGFAAGVGTGLVVRPRASAAQDDQPAMGTSEWSRMPSAPALATQPAASANAGPATGKVWCGSKTVIGGFCVLN